MKQVTMIKSGGREIVVNDNTDAVKVMMADGWKLKPVKAKEKPKAKKDD